MKPNCPHCMKLSAILLTLLAALSDAALLLYEDFSCAASDLGCNASGGITNLSYWRWSTTGSKQSYLTVRNATGGRSGNEVYFRVDYCKPPSPNPEHLGCYRSELALARDVQAQLVDWSDGIGTSERWFGFSNRLPDLTWDATNPLNGPSFQLHGAGGEPRWASLHPVLNLQVDATGCAVGDKACPRWTVGVSAGQQANASCSERYDACWDLGPALVAGSKLGTGAWNDWVVQWRGSPTHSGYLAVWRNGRLVLPKVFLPTAYNDTSAPYVKFGVYHSQWKGEASAPKYAQQASIAYGALRVGDAASSYAEVSTMQ